MKRTKPEIKIVCDVDGCSELSAYRLTFNNGSSYFVCKNCYEEMKKFFTCGENNEEAKQN